MKDNAFGMISDVEQSNKSLAALPELRVWPCYRELACHASFHICISRRIEKVSVGTVEDGSGGERSGEMRRTTEEC